MLTLAVLSVGLIACSRGSDAPPTLTATVVPSPTSVPTPEPTIEPVTTLLFTGDVIPARCVHTQVQARGGDWRLPFEALHDRLSAADITIGTLDSTISDAVRPTGCVPTFSLGGVAAVAGGLQYAGYDVMSHAANHIKDGGEQAMLDTIANLKAAGIQPTGSGADLFEARAPAVVVRNGVSFAFLGYDDIAPYYWATDTTSGAAPVDADTIAEDIMNARKYAHVVVIVPHWGVEYTSVPSARQREFARAAIAAGADLIVGNHPHWVQGARGDRRRVRRLRARQLRLRPGLVGGDAAGRAAGGHVHGHAHDGHAIHTSPHPRPLPATDGRRLGGSLYHQAHRRRGGGDRRHTIGARSWRN